MRPGRIWGAIAGLVALGLLVYLLSGMLMPFVAGLLVAYFLDPLADRLERAGCSRTLAVALIVAAFFLAAVILLVLLIPVLHTQVTGFIERVPAYVDALRAQLGPLLDRLAAVLPDHALDQLRAAAGSQAGGALQWLGGLIGGVLQGGAALIGLLSLVVITPLVAFYMLRDWDRIIRHVDDLLPRHIAGTVREQAAEIDRTLAAFVRGQATVCLLLAAFYGIGLSLVGLEFGLIVGIGTGLISFVPYFGMGLGLVVGLGIALAQFATWGPIALVAAVFAAGQVIEGNFLTPRLVGGRVGLHPVWVIFAVLAGGSLFGFTGVIIAIPTAAAAGVLVRFAIARYRRSLLYTEGGDSGS